MRHTGKQRCTMLKSARRSEIGCAVTSYPYWACLETPLHGLLERRPLPVLLQQRFLFQPVIAAGTRSADSFLHAPVPRSRPGGVSFMQAAKRGPHDARRPPSSLPQRCPCPPPWREPPSDLARLRKVQCSPYQQGKGVSLGVAVGERCCRRRRRRRSPLPQVLPGSWYAHGWG